MLYSFDFAAQVTRICMDEIRRRGIYLLQLASYINFKLIQDNMIN